MTERERERKERETVPCKHENREATCNSLERGRREELSPVSVGTWIFKTNIRRDSEIKHVETVWGHAFHKQILEGLNGENYFVKYDDRQHTV